MIVPYLSIPLAYADKKIDKSKPVFYDSETDSLYGNVTLAQFKQEDWDEALVVEFPNREKLKHLLKQLHLVIYNSSYDLGLLRIKPRKLDDMFFASKTAYPLLESFSLADVAPRYYFGMDKKAMQKSFTQVKKTGIFTDEQLLYGALDVFALESIWLDPRIQYIVANNLAYLVDVKAQLHAVIYGGNGMPVILDAHKKAVIETEKLRKDSQEELNSLVGTELNVKSYQQKQKAFPELPIDPKTGKIPTGAPAFKKLYIENEELNPELSRKAKLVLDTTKARTNLQDLEKYAHTDRVYSYFNVAGARTGRFTSVGGDTPYHTNIQNIGRHYKHIFGYPDNVPRTLVSGDYGTAELIAGASIHNIGSMVQAIQDGVDLHKSGVEAMFNIPFEEVTKEQRQAQKAINFGFIFGLGAERFVAYAYDTFGVKFTEKEAKVIKAKYYASYPEIKIWHEQMGRNVKKSGFTVKTALGRVVHPDRYNDSLNIPIQGSVAEATKMAINFLYEDYATLFESGVMLINTVHDSITLDCPDELVDEAEKALHDSMILAWDELSIAKLFQVKLPITVDIDKGKTWK